MSAALRAPETVADTGISLRLAELPSPHVRTYGSYHGVPHHAGCIIPGSLGIHFDPDGISAEILIHIRDATLAVDLAAAINAVIAKHTAPAPALTLVEAA